MARSKITELIQAFYALNEVEQAVFLDQVDPQPDPEPQVAKKTRKKRASKSAHAESLSAAIAKKGEASNGADAENEGEGPMCAICHQPADHSDHDPTYLSSHVFEAPKSVKAAGKRSSRKGAGTNSTPNPETSSEGALAVGAAD